MRICSLFLRSFANLSYLSGDVQAAYGQLFGMDAVAQELIQGSEYTVIMVANADERLYSVVPVKVEVKRGITLSGETEKNSTIIAACEAIHIAIPMRELYNIQLILTDAAGRCRSKLILGSLLPSALESLPGLTRWKFSWERLANATSQKDLDFAAIGALTLPVWKNNNEIWQTG